MANKTISMTQIKRIIQLRNEGVSKLKISKRVGIHRKTLDDYLFKIEFTGKSYSELLSLNEIELGAIVYSSENTKQPDKRLEELKKNFDYYNQELNKVGVTRKILWEEYKLSHPDGYGYTQFCEHFARYNQRNKATIITSIKIVTTKQNILIPAFCFA